jgi:hypothetical protein
MDGHQSTLIGHASQSTPTNEQQVQSVESFYKIPTIGWKRDDETVVR